jgi:hypothetical protein
VNAVQQSMLLSPSKPRTRSTVVGVDEMAGGENRAHGLLDGRFGRFRGNFGRLYDPVPTFPTPFEVQPFIPVETVRPETLTCHGRLTRFSESHEQGEQTPQKFDVITFFRRCLLARE